MNIVRKIGFLLLILGGNLSLYSQISLPEAVEQGTIILKAKGTGGYQGQCLEVSLRNLSESAIRVIVPAGSYFESIDGDIQDLVVTSRHEAEIAAGQVRSLRLWTMCTQSHNSSPYSGADYAFIGMGSTGLTRLAETIATNHYQNSTAQSAVWVMTSGESASTVYGIDTVESRSLANVLSEELEIPMERFVLDYRPHTITTINASLECFLDQEAKSAKLVMKRPDGTVYREYFRDRALERGFSQFKIGASHTMDSTAEFSLELIQDGIILASKQLTRFDTILVLDTLHTEAIVPVQLAGPSQVEVALFDQEDRFVMTIQPEREWPEGFHRSRIRVSTPVLPGQTYAIKAISDEGVLGTAVVKAGEEMPELHEAREVSGTWNFVLEENPGSGRISVYNTDGELIRIFAEFENLQPGRKNFRYQFHHREGPGASFILKLENNERIIMEQPLRSE